MNEPSSHSPVSAALEKELLNRVRQQGIVVWLDLHGHYTEFVDELAARDDELPYAVRAFRDSYLELLLSLEPVGRGSAKPPLLIHLPGFTEDTVRESPFLELYFAGVRYRKSLETLVTEAAAQRVSPERIEAFVSQPGLTLEGADLWLDALLSESAGGMAQQLRVMSADAVIDDLLRGGFVADRLGDQEDAQAVWTQLEVWTGLPERWRDLTLPATEPRAENVAFSAASWALCVEYVDDLARAPVADYLTTASSLPRAVRDGCRGLAKHLRRTQPDFYGRCADETEALLDEERRVARAEDLGRIDTFRFEEEKVLEAALVALQREEWDRAVEWADLRIEGKSFWLQRDPSRLSAWRLVRDAGRLGQAIVAAGPSLGSVESHEEALERYRDAGAAVDFAHRQLEQRRQTLLYPRLPAFETLRACLDQLRRVWRVWADGWARDFNAVCRARGFLPPASAQQRALFDEVVCPFTRESGTTALFVVDALRYEMGKELFESLAETSATKVLLEARLAELPTVTEVGMNVLAPVVEAGRLQPHLDKGKVRGFSAGEFRVSDPATRKRAMQSRVGGTNCPWLPLQKVLSQKLSSLKGTVKKSNLLIVHSREIDDAGEKGMGPAVFDQVMQKLRAAWRILRDAGVRRFVITSDHGFLLVDDAAESAQPHGRRIDGNRRHVFTDVGADAANEVRVPLSELEYEGQDGHVVFPETTAVFQTARRATGFVHGGNSLQERVIPVLTVVHARAAGGSATRYSLSTEVCPGVAGLHCLQVKLQVDQKELSFSVAKEVELALRVPDPEGVQVELVQVRGGKARLVAGAILATVDEPFEVFFRLTGAMDARACVEVYHPSRAAEVATAITLERFAVTPQRGQQAVQAAEERKKVREPKAPEPDSSTTNWLEHYADTGVRALFEHMAAHGVVTESEALTMLGNQRKLRRFSRAFEAHARLAPFDVRIDNVGGVKRYVREGTAP